MAYFVARVGVVVAVLGGRRFGPGHRRHPILRRFRYRLVGISHELPEPHEILVEKYLKASSGGKQRGSFGGGGGGLARSLDYVVVAGVWGEPAKFARSNMT